MNKQKLIQQAEKLCCDWRRIHHQLLIEPNYRKKERLLYEELMLERAFHALSSHYWYDVIRRIIGQ